MDEVPQLGTIIGAYFPRDQKTMEPRGDFYIQFDDGRGELYQVIMTEKPSHAGRSTLKDHELVENPGYLVIRAKNVPAVWAAPWKLRFNWRGDGSPVHSCPETEQKSFNYDDMSIKYRDSELTVKIGGVERTIPENT